MKFLTDISMSSSLIYIAFTHDGKFSVFEKIVVWSVSIINTIQYNAMQYNTTQYNTMQYNTTQYNTMQYNTVRYNTIEYNIVL